VSQEKIQKPGFGIKCKLSLDPVDQILANEKVFAVVSFGEQCVASGNSRHFQSGLPSINQVGLKEVWFGDLPVKHGITDGCYWAGTDSLLFVALWIQESETGNLSDGIKQAYDRILAFIKSRGYSKLVRVWNHFADINAGMDDQERYKQFCHGRHQALVKAGYGKSDFSAASAVGHKAGNTIIYLIAGRDACTHFENPRQVSAYCYPREYGPQSPSFARATYYGSDGNGIVFFSGTASIIGHETRNEGDLQGQLDVTLDNLDKLTESIARQIHPNRPIKPDVLKVYIRHPDQLDSIRTRIESHFGEQPQVAYLQADICRADLLVEIEAVCAL
jgi:chorismate lyase/3-hydroxybenzoate synthase